jgi:serpin B
MNWTHKLLLVATLSCGAAATGLGAGMAGSNNAFALEVMSNLGGDPPSGNLAFSPYSMVTAFAMVHAGARGETASQMERLFGFPGQAGTPAAVAGWSAALNNAVTGDSAVLKSANRIWVQEKWPVEADFLKVLNDAYAAPAGTANFVTQPEAGRIAINDWVHQETLERIEDLLPPGALDGSTRFVLVNALYFRAPWKQTFDTAATADADFQVSAGETLTVRMMRGRRSVPYLETQSAQAITLPLDHGSFSLVVVLPKPGVAMQAVSDEISAGGIPLGISAWPATPHDLEVFLPRFRVTGEIDLQMLLPRLGVTDAFSPSLADFSGIHNGPEPDLHLSAAYHKAFVEVTEAGLEAAAATAVVGGVTSIPPPFRVNRPFLFFVTEDTTGTVLLAGRVMRPVNPIEGTSGFEGWRAAYFAKKDLEDKKISGLQGTPMGDGVPNLLKYALGLRPMDPAGDAQPRPIPVRGRRLGIEWVGAPAADVETSVETSTNLKDWKKLSGTPEVVEALDEKRSRMRMLSNEMNDEGMPLFLRLRVAVPES